MADLHVKIVGLDVVRSRLRALPLRLRTNIMRGGLRAAARVVQIASRQEAPRGKTGNLRRSISVSTRSKLGGAVVEAKVKAGGRRAWYANIVESGAKPHRIEARRGKALQIGPAFVASVQHPGFAGRGFMAKARERSAVPANLAFQRYVDQRIATFWNTGK